MIVTVLAAAAGAVMVAPVAAAASPEYRIHWSRGQVADVRDNIARGDFVCGYSGAAAGVDVGVLVSGPAGVAAGAGLGLLGLLCGHNDQPLRNAVDEAYWRKCGIDAYFTDGPMSYDTNYRYVVCP